MASGVGPLASRDGVAAQGGRTGDPGGALGDQRAVEGLLVGLGVLAPLEVLTFAVDLAWRSRRSEVCQTTSDMGWGWASG